MTNLLHNGAKKYAYEKNGEISITVAGVPKSGSKQLKSLNEFKDNFVFKYEYTNKHTIAYCDNQKEIIMKDYQGNEYKLTDKKGCCLLPASYTLGKSLEYCQLLTDSSSKRAKYKE